MAFEVAREEDLFEISKLKKISVLETKDGKRYVNIREYFFNDEGKKLPTRKGVMLAPDTFIELLSKHEELAEKIRAFIGQ